MLGRDVDDTKKRKDIFSGIVEPLIFIGYHTISSQRGKVNMRNEP